MQAHVLKIIRGYVAVTVRGKQIESLINDAARGGISLWDIRRTSASSAVVYVTIHDFYRLRPLLKRTGCRVHVEKRFGFPFFLARLEKRKFFIAGLAGFFIGLFLLSSLVWDIRVEGNDRIPTKAIMEAAKNQGIKEMQWKFRLKDPDELSMELQKQIPDASWIGVEIQGTRVLIKVVEATRPEKQELVSPRHLVASKSAVVTQISATKGKPLVQPNTYVRKGDVLISGIIGDEANRQIVPAKGSVKGIVWYESSIEAPLVRRQHVYTGKSFGRFYLVFGNRALQITGYGKEDYEESVTEEDRKIISYKKYTLPFGSLKETVREARLVETPIALKTAEKDGIERAKANILAGAGEGARLVSYQVLQSNTEKGKVLLKVLFQVEESIAVEQPIVEGP